jgi:hypothetical protein
MLNSALLKEKNKSILYQIIVVGKKTIMSSGGKASEHDVKTRDTCTRGSHNLTNKQFCEVSAHGKVPTILW